MKLYRYRYEDTYFGVIVNLMEFEVVKATPKGYWIRRVYYRHQDEVSYGKERWMNKSAKRKYAYAKKEEALLDLKRRTEIRISLLEGNLRVCSDVIKQIEQKFS